MRPADVRVAHIASGQLGIVTYKQALEAGLTARQIQVRIRSGAFVAVHRGVYRIASLPSFEQSLLAACLASRGVASHRAAAQVWGLRGIEGAPTEITVRGRRRPELSQVTAHSSDLLERADVARRGAIPLTSPARTLLDLGAVAPRLVEAAVEDALLRRLVTVGSLHRVVERVGDHGRRGTRALRTLLEARDPALAPTESLLEDAIISVLRRHNLPEPTRQQWVLLPNGRRIRLDISYPDALLGIEGNGLRWHSSGPDVRRDQARANMLTAMGWVLLCFTWDDVRHHASEIARQVATVRAARLGSLASNRRPA